MATTENISGGAVTGRTAGEWHAVDRGTGWEIHRIDPNHLAWLAKEFGPTRAKCWCGVDGCAGALPEGMRTDFHNKADAVLAAAAPDLLAELRKIHAALCEMETMHHVERMEWFESKGLDLVYSADEVIARATGAP